MSEFIEHLAILRNNRIIDLIENTWIFLILKKYFLGKSEQPTDTSEFGFHSKILLSLAQLRSKSGSEGFQSMESTPRWWFCRLFKGDEANRKSHNSMIGDWSSSDAMHSWVAMSGCHCIAFHFTWNFERKFWNCLFMMFEFCFSRLPLNWRRSFLLLAPFFADPLSRIAVRRSEQGSIALKRKKLKNHKFLFFI